MRKDDFMKDWIYAKSSHEMSKHGGPVQYIAKIRRHEYQKTARALNRKWLIGTIPTLVLLVPFAAKGVYDLIEEHRKKSVITDEEAQQAEQELIRACEESELEEPPC